MTDPLNLMFRGLCAAARQIGWHPIRADHPALEIYGDEGRELARRMNRVGVRLYLSGESGFDSFAELVDVDPAGAAGFAAARAAIEEASAESPSTEPTASMRVSQDRLSDSAGPSASEVS